MEPIYVGIYIYIYNVAASPLVQEASVFLHCTATKKLKPIFIKTHANENDVDANN